VNHKEHCDALEVEVSRFASLLDEADFAVRVPSCPEWSVADLVSHLGLIHRWSERLVVTLAQERVPPSTMDLDLEPISAGWLRHGGVALVETLRAADPDAVMWSWGRDHHVRFWSRRQLQETMMHRVDLELALGTAITVEEAVSCDAIDELLVNLESAAAFSPKVRELKGHGEILTFRATNGPAAWTIRLTEEGFSFTEPTREANVALSGTALDVLLLLYRRAALDAVDVEVSGDRRLMEFWLTHSALE
jgi:uncharacterized protein (TIGR03083 family)